MSNKSRRHHFPSQRNLKGFAEDEAKTVPLIIIDGKDSGKKYGHSFG